MKQNLTLSPSPTDRRGVSLIELVITMSVAGVILLMGIGTLRLMLTTENNLHHSLKRRQTVAQLSDAFRRDVHAARDVIWNEPENDEDSGSLIVELAADHQVKYTTDKHTLLRTETQNQQTLQTARFRFSAGTEIAFDPRDENGIAVVIRNHNTTPNSPRTTDSRAPQRELRIQAVAGRDHRFEKAANP